MEQKKQEGKSWRSLLKECGKPVLLGTLTGVIGMGVILCIAAFLFGLFHIPSTLIPAVAVVTVTVGGWLAGFVSAKIRKQRGMLTGGFSALLLAMLLLGAGCFLVGAPSVSAFTRAAVILAAGMLGGVLGVNGKRHELGI
ncbi:MAG: TIGR04086 family membrane protein [Candidatus Merdivicinus sp.]